MTTTTTDPVIVALIAARDRYTAEIHAQIDLDALRNFGPSHATVIEAERNVVAAEQATCEAVAALWRALDTATLDSTSRWSY